MSVSFAFCSFWCSERGGGVMGGAEVFGKGQRCYERGGGVAEQ